MGKIRNIIQTVQNREIIKTAPDIVVYLDGLPYLENSFLTTNASNPFLVNHNDYVTSFSGNYDTDQMIPTCNITLAIPAHQRYMFQAPGGNNLIKTMMQVQVFLKGYYFAADGNTLFNRVFKGFTSHVSHTDDGKMLLISIQCSGILGFFEMMQIDLSPAIQSSSPISVTPLKSILNGMSPYQQLAFTFLYPSNTDGFYTNALPGFSSAIQDTPYFDAVQSGFVAKWQTILAEICQDAHIYGLQNKDVQDVVTFLKSIASASTNKGTKSWSFLAAQEAFYTNIKESQQATDMQNTAKIQQFLPDMGIGSISLVNGRVVTRLEFLRTLSHLINYECYQDIDGQIIIKPPLYNLDVTNLGSTVSTTTSTSSSNNNPPITKANNPFIVHLSEITNETMTEDQGAVRATRMVIQGNTTTDTQFHQNGPTMRATAEFMDLSKLSQFGLREEPARTIPWLLNNETASCFAQAAAELALANKGFRTYSFSIPARPEIKLGFPMFIPHRDMYGYVKNVSISFTIGGEATMNITLDTLRRRAMFPQAQTKNGQTGVVYVAQPNLVLKWVQGGSTQPAVSDTSNSPANQIGDVITVPKPPNSPSITADQAALIAFQQQQMGSYYALSSDTTNASWQVQADSDNVWSASDPTNASGFSRSVSVNEDFNFYQAVRTTIPYTDEKGYELVAPFPWGRWLDVNTAIQEFTQDGYVFKPATQDSTYAILNGANTFIYAGMTTPTSSTDASSQLSTALASTPQAGGSTSTSSGNTSTAAPGATPSSPSSAQPDITVFELNYSNFTPGGANGIIQVAQPSNSLTATALAAAGAAETLKVNMFLTGTAPKPDQTLASKVQATSNGGLSAGQGTNQIPLSPGQFASND